MKTNAMLESNRLLLAEAQADILKYVEEFSISNGVDSYIEAICSALNAYLAPTEDGDVQVSPKVQNVIYDLTHIAQFLTRLYEEQRRIEIFKVRLECEAEAA